MRRALAIALLFCLSGCVGLYTSDDKTASFEPYSTRRVAGLPLERFLSDRTLPLLCGAEFEPVARGVGVHEQGDASAVAITRDGYLLTAAHCVAEEPLLVVLFRREGGGSRIALVPARVVWTGKGDLDLAIIKIEHALDATFAWASDDSLQTDTPVVVAGCCNAGERRSIEARSVSAGHLLGHVYVPDEKGGEDTPPLGRLLHDSPILPGDSGGALATLDGRLVGITSGVFFPTFLGLRTGRYSVAVRPSKEWIAGRIAEDRRAHGK